MQYIKAINPATLEEIGQVEATPPEKVAEYVSKAHAEFHPWSKTSFRQRAAYIMKAREYMLDNIEEFARTITLDNGKPLAESYSAELFSAASLMYWAAKNAGKILKRKSICIGIFNLMGRSSTIGYQPVGVVGVISPWNYPFSIPVGAVVMALMAGNCVVLKTSSATPLVGKKIEEMFAAAGLPESVFTHIPGGSDVGEALINSGVDKIMFTGSAGVGKHVAEICAKRLTPCTLELGGKDAAIIRADANLEHASSGVVWGAFTNAGQCCASIERVYVHESVADKFIKLVTKKTKMLRVGNGLDPNTDIGPLTTAAQLETTIKHVEDAKNRGATIISPSPRPSPARGEGDREEGYFYAPTIIIGADHSFPCVMEETFGPTLPIMTYSEDSEAVRLANDTEFGLNAYIWSKNTAEAKKIATGLRAGTIVINDAVYIHAIPETPWGGVKYSGYGRTHGRFGFHEMVNIHHIHTNPVTFIKDFWWYPYGEKITKNLKKLSRTLTGDFKSIVKSVLTLFKALFRKLN